MSIGAGFRPPRSGSPRALLGRAGTSAQTIFPGCGCVSAHPQRLAMVRMRTRPRPPVALASLMRGVGGRGSGSLTARMMPPSVGHSMSTIVPMPRA